MAGCVCEQEMAYNSSSGEGSELLCAPTPPTPHAIPHPTYTERKRKGGGGERGAGRCLVRVCAPFLFQGKK